MHKKPILWVSITFGGMKQSEKPATISSNLANIDTSQMLYKLIV